MEPVLTFGSIRLPAGGFGSKSALPDLLPSFNIQNRDRSDLPEEEGVYVGYGRVENVFPYTRRKGYTRTLETVSVSAAVLENDRLRAVFLPDQGGRLWRLYDKEAGRDLLYTNDVLRYSDLAVCGAWFSGGVEWNIGVIGHSPFTTEKLFTAETVMPSGAPVLRFYEYERIRGVFWQIDCWLEKDDRFLNVRVRIENPSDDTIPMYWWSNIAVPELPGGRIAVPAGSAYTHAADGRIIKTGLPLEDGTDVTCYQTLPFPVDYFFDIPAQSPRFVAALAADGYGLLQLSTSRLQSRKLFSWGHAPSSTKWQQLLTREACPYLEIQAGLPKTQYGCLPMPGRCAWEWLEQYGPLRVAPSGLKEPFAGWRGLAEAAAAPFFAGLDERLAESRPMALTPGRLKREGCPYGALARVFEPSAAAQLDFGGGGALRPWLTWLKGGPAPRAEAPEESPEGGVFFERPAMRRRLIEAAEQDPENLLLQYHAGLAAMRRQDFKAAETFLRRAGEAAPSPLADHALACLYLRLGDKPKALASILRGAAARPNSLDYQMEAFRLLERLDCPGDICRLWEGLAPDLQANKRLRLGYTKALSQIGRAEEAFRLLTENGGLVPDDIHEGDHTLSDLYRSLHQTLYGTPGEIPETLDFRMKPD